MKRKSIVIFFLILSVAFTMAACGNSVPMLPGYTSEGMGSDFSSSEVPEFVFRYAENQAVDYPTTQGAFKFAELVDKETNGRIKIKVYPNAQLGDEYSVIEQVQFGSIDFTRASIGTLAEFLSSLNVLQIPYLYRDDAHMWAVLDGELGDDFLESVGDFGVAGLSWYGAGARSFYSKKEITSLEDLKGQSIRIQNSSMMFEMIKALEATPFPIVFSEVYSAFQIGAIDSAENNLPSYESTAHYEVAKYFLLNEHTRVPEMQIISKLTMEKLSDEDKAIIRKCAGLSAQFEREQWIKREEESLKKAIANGAIIIPISDEEKLKFRDACQSLYDKFYVDYMDIIEKIIATE